MKITDSRKKNSNNFGELSFGSVFQYNSAIFIKTDSAAVPAHQFNALRLDTTQRCNLRHDSEVTLLNAEIIIKD